MGRPGMDFPVLPSIPQTSFSCRKVKGAGYYADLETDCQVSASREAPRRTAKPHCRAVCLCFSTLYSSLSFSQSK